MRRTLTFPTRLRPTAFPTAPRGLRGRACLVVCGVVAALTAGFAPAPVHAQEPASHLAGWYSAEGRWLPDGQRWGAELDVQLRDFQIAEDFALVSVRGGLLLAPESLPLRLTVGGALFFSGQVGEDDALSRERRIYQTLTLGHDVGPGLRLRHRLRTEQRWFEVDGFRSRYRYRLGLALPLQPRGTDGPYALVSNEVLLNGETRLDSGRRVDRLDQNRVYLALNWPLRRDMRLETGYLNITRDARPEHRIRVTLKARIR